MRVLAYCVTDGRISASLPAGVEGALVESAMLADFRIYFSCSSTSASGSSLASADVETEFRFGTEEHIRQCAMAFHNVNVALFRQTDIVPFRFPTLLSSLSELKSFVEHNHNVFADSLAITHQKVQMEVWIGPARSDRSCTDSITSTRGAAYLREKAALWKQMEAQADALRQRLASSMLEWRQIEQRDCLRCYALVVKSEAEEFRRAVSGGLSDDDLPLRVTGPWPPVQFMPLDRLRLDSYGRADVIFGEAAKS